MSAPQPQRRPYFKSNRKPNRNPSQTHFIAVPLHTNSALRARVAAFQAGLFKPAFHPDGTRKPPIRGLDRSIVIDPIRFHLTLGVMTLAEEDSAAEEKESQSSGASSTLNMPSPSSNTPIKPYAPASNPSGPTASGASRSQSSTLSTTMYASSSNLTSVPNAPPLSCSVPHGTSSNSESTSTPDLSTPSASPLQSPTLIPTPPSLFPHNGTSPQKPPRQQQRPPARPPTPAPAPPQPLQTVSTALALLRSLKPQIDAIINGSPSPPRQSPETTVVEAVPAPVVGNERGRGPGLEVVLEALDIMRPVRPKVPKPRRPRPAKNMNTETMVTESRIPAEEINAVETVEAKTGEEIIEMGTVELDEESEETTVAPGPPAAGDDLPLSPEPTNADAITNEDTPDPDDVWADVMYLAPKETGEDGVKLRRIADLVNSTFRREGYVIERRPLRLHCTVLNTSKRRPARTRGQPFSYSDLLRSDALRLLGASPTLADAILPATTSFEVEASTTTTAVSTGNITVTSAYSTTTATTTATNSSTIADPTALVGAKLRLPRKPGPVPVSLNTDEDGNTMAVRARELGLWIMGSRGPRGEYVSCGDVPFLGWDSERGL